MPDNRDDFNRIALDPRHSVVVEACAGSGKTWLLVSRIVRLLLDGAKPSEILAITFTRKAAQEMQARLRQWLHDLALKPDAEVLDFLRQRAVPEPELQAMLPQARGLLESFLTARPGITINTFHGWFLQWLQCAPLKSGAAGNVGLLEQTSALLDEAWQSFAEDLQQQPGSEAARDLDYLFREYGPGNTRNLLLNFVARRAEWWSHVSGKGDALEFACNRLQQELGISPDADVVAELFRDGRLESQLREFAAMLAGGSAAEQKAAAGLERGDAPPASYFRTVCEAFFTKTGGLRTQLVNSAGKRGAESLHADICAALQQAENALTEQAVLRFNRAAINCGLGVLGHYQRLKQDRRLMDFTDVEWRASDMLANSDHAEYLQYKLDSRYRHILLDEFQDTNPLQWQVMRAWLAASAAAETNPAVFVVGDPKQSIYRFRRAEPRLFEIAADFLEREFGARRLTHNVSYRNAPAILAAVNRLFSAEPGFAHFEAHLSKHAALPGVVELLPLAQGESATPGNIEFRNPLEQPLPATEGLKQQHEAQWFAEKISAIVGKWVIKDDHYGQRPAEFRDIMVLVRNRTHLAAYEQALKAARIPYVSTRQGGLLETMEAGDLTALLKFLIIPFADLELARALRSPIFNCSDEELMALAQLNEGTWWQRLGQLAAEQKLDGNLARAFSLLQGWQQQVDRLPVHDLLDRIYFEGDVLRRYEAATPATIRLGVLANLQAFLELALGVESGRYPSLPRFLDELSTLHRAPAEEAPDEGIIDTSGNALRIHTVHGAKGLEAPIVWLLDADAGGGRNDSYGVLLDWPPEQDAPHHFSLYSRKNERGRNRAAYFDAEAEFEARENLNLLYVAMTRARQVLIVSGTAAGGESWYKKISRAMGEEKAASFPEEGLKQPKPAAKDFKPDAASLPPALNRPLPTGKKNELPLNAARQYGIHLHALLERMAPPNQIPDKASMQRLLGLAAEEFAPLWEDACAILEAPQLQRFFDSRCYLRACNELSYATAGGEVRRIDRLVEFEDSLWILDYKTTEKIAAGDPERHAAPYRSQLQAYREAISKIYPDKPVHCALIFGGALFHQLPE